MKYPCRAILVLIMLAVLVPQVHAEEKLGRLFLTPERRALLERQRQLNLQEQKTLEGTTLQLDGVILRSSGKKTVWINGQTQNDNNNSLGVKTRIEPNAPGQAELSAEDNEQAELRVGQKINRATQVITDGLDGGRLEVNPPPQSN
ncbi:MAG: hypothetical protein WAO76_15400 [Georgfuchsia sp.]